MLDKHGFRMRGFTKDDARAIHGDSLRHAVEWKGKSFSNLPDEQYTLRLHLEGDATLYAVNLY